MTRTPIGTPLDGTVRATTGAQLQGLMIDLIALGLHGKQLHWHVVGTNFKNVHEQLDEIIDDARTASDEVAERAITVGVPVDGRPAAVAKENTLPELPEGWVQDADAVERYAEAVTAVVTKARTAVGELEAEPASQDLVIGILQTFEKHLWMLQAQLQS